MRSVRLIKGRQAIVKFGDAGAEAMKEHLAFKFPPKSLLDVYLAQKFFYEEKNGIQFMSPSVKAVPVLFFHDAEMVFNYWEKIVKKFANKGTSVKKPLERMRENIYVTSMVRLLGVANFTPESVKLFYLSPLSRSKNLDERENEKFWNDIGKIANDLDNKKVQDGWGDAWDALVEAGEELPGRLKKVANAARDVGVVLVDTVAKPSNSVASALGDIIGNFFSGIAKGVSSPIGAVLTVGAGIYVWKKWPQWSRRSGPPQQKQLKQPKQGGK